MQLDIGYSVSAKLVQGILIATENMGLSSADLLAAIGLSPIAIAHPDDRITHRQWAALWQAIAQQTNDPSAGAQLAALTQFESFSVTGYAMSHSATLEAALTRLTRYSRLLYEGMEFSLVIEGAIAQLTYQTVSPALVLPAISVGWTLANIMLWAERNLGAAWPLIKINLQQPAPADQTAYTRIFNAPLHFNTETNALLFDASWLNAPLLRPDSGLCEVLDRYADSLLASLPRSDEFMQRLHHLLAELLTEALPKREPTLEVLSQRLGYSPRTLQRKLQMAGTSFQTVLDTLRQQLAYQYLQNPQITNSEIAWLLGFSEDSAFNRAFRRWQGMSPGSYRKALQMTS